LVRVVNIGGGAYFFYNTIQPICTDVVYIAAYATRNIALEVTEVVAFVLFYAILREYAFDALVIGGVRVRQSVVILDYPLAPYLPNTKNTLLEKVY
jgi:hypothetical protein